MIAQQQLSSKRKNDHNNGDNDDEYDDIHIILDIKEFDNTNLLSFIDSYSIIGLDTERPIVKVGNFVFEGTWDQYMGTAMLFKHEQYSSEAEKSNKTTMNDNNHHHQTIIMSSNNNNSNSSASSSRNHVSNNDHTSASTTTSTVSSPSVQLQYELKTRKVLRLSRILLKPNQQQQQQQQQSSLSSLSTTDNNLQANHLNPNVEQSS